MRFVLVCPDKEKMIKLNFKIKPLSVNQVFQGRRYKTQICKNYENELWFLLPKKKKIKGWVAVEYDFYLKNFAQTDCDNLIKVLQDLLVRKEYFEDDRKIVDYKIRKHKSRINKIGITIRGINL